jgi:hypothetical protein
MIKFYILGIVPNCPPVIQHCRFRSKLNFEELFKKKKVFFLKDASHLCVNVFTLYKDEFVRSKVHSPFKEGDSLFEKSGWKGAKGKSPFEG